MWDLYNNIRFFLSTSLVRFVKSSVIQERAEEHCTVREVESFHSSAHQVELEDCFTLYTKDEEVG